MEIFVVLRKAPQSPHSFVAFASTTPTEIVQFLQKSGFQGHSLPRWSQIEGLCRDSFYYDLEDEIDNMKFRVQLVSGLSSFVSFSGSSIKIHS